MPFNFWRIDRLNTDDLCSSTCSSHLLFALLIEVRLINACIFRSSIYNYLFQFHIQNYIIKVCGNLKRFLCTLVCRFPAYADYCFDLK